MKLEEIAHQLEYSLSPKVFTLEDEFYGIQYGIMNYKNIKRVLLTLEVNINTIHYAIKNKINLIISIKGLFQNKIQYISNNLTKRLNLLSKYPILIFIINSSFIAAEGGISDTIMEVLSLKLERILEVDTNINKKVPIGRVCSPKPYPSEKAGLSLDALIKRIRNNFENPNIPYIGDLNKRIKNICVIGGRFLDTSHLERAPEDDINCFITNKIDHLDFGYVKELGLSLIQVPYHKSAILAIKRLYNLLSIEFPQDEFFLIQSDDPLKIYK